MNHIYNINSAKDMDYNGWLVTSFVAFFLSFMFPSKKENSRI
jgi:hypothetical protein